jgi:hypothetical protein
MLIRSAWCEAMELSQNDSEWYAHNEQDNPASDSAESFGDEFKAGDDEVVGC